MFDRLLDLLQSLWEALLPWIVLQPYQAGVLIRLGVYKRTLGPGFHWILPFSIDRVWDENTTPKTHHLSGLSTTTKDGKSIGFDAVITYQISDVEKAVLKVTQVEDAVIDTCTGIIGTALSDSTWDDVLHGRVVDELTKLCRARGWRWGIEIMSVQLAGVCLVKNIRLSGSAGGSSAMTITHTS
jgi:regulator of protease activity HflC (stomatin/prohibitin superfamily)